MIEKPPKLVRLKIQIIKPDAAKKIRLIYLLSARQGQTAYSHII